MNLLNKYHKQGFPKELKNNLIRLNKTYNLKYDNSLKSLFHLMVFKEGLKNKEMFEKTFERFRNNHLDMWENLEFNERNMLVKHDLDPVRARMSHFNFEDSIIYIPFFDVLMNNLYHRETAVLELPQFFKLYENFNDSIIDMAFYGNLPFIHNMSDLEFIKADGQRLVLYFNQNRTLYLLEGDKVEVFPFLETSSLTQEMTSKLSQFILDNQMDELLDYADFYKLLHPKLSKKMKKRNKK